jgi:pimeloyl-ACP methyl ester carboxylesterase
MARKTAIVATWTRPLALLMLLLAVACTPIASGPTLQVEWAPPPHCIQGTQESGSVYIICMPGEGQPPWNGKLLLFAHGYVAVDQPIEIPADQMVLPGPAGVISVNDLVTSMGYAFAASSYSMNGLAILPAIEDLIDLVDIFATLKTTPTDVLLTGVSEGGLITTLAIERHPDVFSGGLAACGPYGDFQAQIDHFGDSRVVFDYFFPGLMPEGPVSIPPDLMENWATSFFSSTIEPAVSDPTNAISVTQFLTVMDILPHTFDPPTSTLTIERLLWYNVFATEDAKGKLGGQPFDNTMRIYSGSEDDVALNEGVLRIAADQTAIDEIEAYYQTSGALLRPLVTLHTTGDFLVPYWHATLYREKVAQAGNASLHRHFRSTVHGHCTFNALEVIAAFQALERMMQRRVHLPLLMQAKTAP